MLECNDPSLLDGAEISKTTHIPDALGAAVELAALKAVGAILRTALRNIAQLGADFSSVPQVPSQESLSVCFDAWFPFAQAIQRLVC